MVNVSMAVLVNVLNAARIVILSDMSRTYRLRHDKSNVAKHFSDGSFTLHTTIFDEIWRNNIVHGIYGAKCFHTPDQDLIEFKKPDYRGPMEVVVNSHRKCWDKFFKSLSQFGTTWWIAEAHLKTLVGDPRYSVAPPSWHEYARPGRHRQYGRSGVENVYKAARKVMHMKIRKAFISGDDSGL